MPAANPITEGDLLPAVLRLAWPVIVSETLHMAFQVVDVIWVGRLGAAATAAATTSMFAIWLVLALSSLVTTGTTAHVARAIGAGDRGRAREATAQAMNLALLLGVGTAVAGVVGARRFFELLGAPPDVVALGTPYLQIAALASPATFLYLLGSAAMRAAGDTRTPMLVVVSAVLANAVLGPLLVYVAGLGVSGAALATAVCQAGAVVAFGALARAGAVPIDARGLGRPDWRRIAGIARVGAPYALMMAGFSLVYFFFSRFAAVWGPAALAVVGLANRLESICYLPADGFAAATATVVGQNLGAGKPGRAARGVLGAALVMAGIAVALTLLYVALPRVVLAVFTNDPEVLAVGTPYLRILALCLVATGVEGVVAGGFAGAGDTLPPLVIHVAFIVVRVPLAGWLAARLGPNGIAWAIATTCTVRAAILCGWFARGRWKARALPGTMA